MALISNYSSVTSVVGSMLFPVWDTRVSDTRKVSLTELSDFIAGNVSANMSGYVTQYASPSTTGFNVSITSGQSDIHLILTPTGTMAAGTITLPLASTCLDGQRVLVNSTQPVTSLTISANGALSVFGAPVTIGAGGYFTLKYDKLTSTWYRVG